MSLSSGSLNRRTFTIAAGSAALAAAAVRGAVAQEASPVVEEEAPGLPPLPEGATVVAEGLFNPRFIAIADDGTMYVTEVGVGGDEPFTFGPPPAAEATPEVAATPVTDEETAPPASRGYTGQITQVSPDGTQSVAVSGLASYSDGVGPHGIVVVDGLVYFLIGGTAVLAGVEPLEGENGLHVFDPGTGEVTQLAEFNTYEIENNPDGTDINPNAFGLAAGRSDGRLTVIDAGSNTVFSVDKDTGALQLRAVFPTIDQFDPEAGWEPRQVVPTDGTYVGTTFYVAFLSEYWPEDAPSVVSVAGDGDFATFNPVATGLSFVTGLTTGPDGSLYVCQLFDDPEAAPMGSIHRIVGGVAEPVVQGLFMPHGIEFDGDGNLYVTTNILVSGPGMPAGQVLRFDGIAAAS
ncbi:MAG: ScyD/ScyE family protein [Chloroflexi bacterium]|nr:ScyD/ScyE family protein [Chloroflexota bacterium]